MMLNRSKHYLDPVSRLWTPTSHCRTLNRTSTLRNSLYMAEIGRGLIFILTITMWEMAIIAEEFPTAAIGMTNPYLGY